MGTAKNKTRSHHAAAAAGRCNGQTHALRQSRTQNQISTLRHVIRLPANHAVGDAAIIHVVLDPKVDLGCHTVVDRNPAVLQVLGVRLASSVVFMLNLLSSVSPRLQYPSFTAPQQVASWALERHVSEAWAW